MKLSPFIYSTYKCTCVAGNKTPYATHRKLCRSLDVGLYYLNYRKEVKGTEHNGDNKRNDFNRSSPGKVVIKYSFHQTEFTKQICLICCWYSIDLQ